MSRVVLLLLSVGLAGLLAATETAARAEVRRATLPSGLQVHVQRLENRALVDVEMVFGAGRATDPDSLAGLAHLAEHLLTESSPAFPDGGLMRQSTLLSTYRNAHTSGGHVTFVTQCLPVFLPRILGLEVERLRGTDIDSVSFARERAVVQEEIAYRTRTTPGSLHLERLHEACYAGHPFGEDVGGTRETVERIELAHFEDFRRTYVRPERAALVVRGPVDPDRTLALVDSLFGGGPAHDPVPLEVPPYPAVAAAQVIGDSPDFEGVRVSVGCRVPLDTPERAAFVRALRRMLDPTRFQLNVVGHPGEALVVMTVHYWYYRPPEEQRYGYVYRAFDPDTDARHALGAIWRGLDEDLEKLRDPAVFAERHERARIEPLGIDVGPILVTGSRDLEQAEVRAAVDGLTRERFIALAHEFLTPPRAGVGITHGRDSGRRAAIDLAGRVAREGDLQAGDALAGLTAAEMEPVIAAYRESGLEFVSRHTLANGIPFDYLAGEDWPKVKLGGCRVLPPLDIQKRGEKPGVDNFYNRIVRYDDRQRRDPDEPRYRPRLLPYETRLRFAPGVLRLRATGPAVKVDRLAFHLARRLDSEKLHQEMWFRATRHAADSLREIRANPANRATAWRWERLFGPDFPGLGYYAPDPDKAEKIQYKDLVKFHEKVAGKTGQTVLYAAGSAPIETVVAALEEHFGTRDRHEPLDQDPAPLAPPAGAQGLVVHDPGRGDVLLEMTLAPVEAAGQTVVDHLLLERLVEQAMKTRLREEEGLTYHAKASFRRLAGWIVWELGVTCQPGQAPLVLREVRGVLERIRAEGFTADEIARARLGVICGLVGDFSDQDDGYDRLASLAPFGGVPDDPIGAVVAAGPDGLAALAARILDPDRLVFTATGPMFEEDIDQFALE